MRGVVNGGGTVDRVDWGVAGERSTVDERGRGVRAKSAALVARLTRTEPIPMGHRRAMDRIDAISRTIATDQGNVIHGPRFVKADR